MEAFLSILTYSTPLRFPRTARLSVLEPAATGAALMMRLQVTVSFSRVAYAEAPASAVSQ